MLWLALHFPSLPLETFARAIPAAGPLAVASSTGGGATLIACNAPARMRGVRPGMTVAAAWALASDLNITVRNENAEKAALERIAAWAFEFTPAVSISYPDEVLLEIEGSLGLFDGLSALHRRIGHAIEKLGYCPRIASAPTPLAAQLFARAGLATRIRHADALRIELQNLPVEFLVKSPEARAMLESFGVRTLGDCLNLPRAGLARRLGEALLNDIDRALGRLPDPRPPFVPPSVFEASLPLPAPVEQSEALLFGAHRLLSELCGWLAATGKGVLRLDWIFAHEASATTDLGMTLVAASRDAEHLLNVLRERLARVELPAAVNTLTLRARALAPLMARSLSFLPDAREEKENTARVSERLRARLGEDAVLSLATHCDHRPERAWRACKHGDMAAAAVSPQCGARPLWLLASPQPLRVVGNVPQYDGPLTVLAGPERIESGWWDGGDVRRDYYVACNPARSLLWIYRERVAPHAWHLHGFFG